MRSAPESGPALPSRSFELGGDRVEQLAQRGQVDVGPLLAADHLAAGNLPHGGEAGVGTDVHDRVFAHRGHVGVERQRRGPPGGVTRDLTRQGPINHCQEQ